MEEDFKRGVLPHHLGSFSDAHDYIDANMYLFDEEHPEPRLGSFYEWEDMDTESISQHFNTVIDALDAWLKDLRKKSAIDYLAQ